MSYYSKYINCSENIKAGTVCFILLHRYTPELSLRVVFSLQKQSRQKEQICLSKVVLGLFEWAYHVGITPGAKKSPTKEQRVLDSTSRDAEPPPTCAPTPGIELPRQEIIQALKRIPVPDCTRRVLAAGSDWLGYKQGHITFPRQDHLQ